MRGRSTVCPEPRLAAPPCPYNPLAGFFKDVDGLTPFEYLSELAKHASVLAPHPPAWMPWNYREALRQIGPKGSSAMFLVPSERRRVRGKGCVLLKLFFHAIASLNSFLPELADTGRNRKEIT